MRLADFPPPRTPAARAAERVLARFASTAIARHSVRSWLFALAFGVADDVRPRDPEVLYVAALLHDIGLSPEFDAVELPFETAGGAVGQVLATGAGWPDERGDAVARIIERHMWHSVDPAEDPDGHLLEVATGLDISGRRADDLPEDFLREVLAAYPRDGLGDDFGRCIADQAARKPDSAAARVAPVALAAFADHPLDRLQG